MQNVILDQINLTLNSTRSSNCPATNNGWLSSSMSADDRQQMTARWQFGTMEGSGCSSKYNQMKPQIMDQNIPNGNLKQQNYQMTYDNAKRYNSRVLLNTLEVEFSSASVIKVTFSYKQLQQRHVMTMLLELLSAQNNKSRINQISLPCYRYYNEKSNFK